MVRSSPVRPCRSFTHVISIPTSGLRKGESELGSGLVGMVVPAIATIEAWWLTLNSTFTTVSLPFDRDGSGMKHGRLCGSGVREMTMEDQGTRQVRWMKRYFRRLEARDMCLSLRW